MFAASGPHVAKGIVVLLAVSLGEASGEPLAPFPGNEPAIATCRAEAHRSVFELETRASDTTGGTPAPSSLCARVMSNPGLRCVIAAASTRCRLARAEVRARGACEFSRAEACEACVMRAIAGPEEPSHDAARASERETTLSTLSVSGRNDTRGAGVTTVPAAMEWQVYLAELDAVARECAHAEAAWRAEAAAQALSRVLEMARDAERAADARDDAARRAAADVLAEVQAARTAATEVSDRLGSVEARARSAEASLVAWRNASVAFARAHGESLRDIEKQAGTISELVASTSTKIDALFAFVETHTRTMWSAVEAAAAAARQSGTEGTLIGALWRLAREAVCSVTFAWRVVARANALLARVVPARYRVLAAAAAAAAMRRARRRRAEATRSRDRRESLALFRRERAEVLAELRALRREARENAPFEPRRRGSPRARVSAGDGDVDEAEAPRTSARAKDARLEIKTAREKSATTPTTRARAKRATRS